MNIHQQGLALLALAIVAHGLCSRLKAPEPLINLLAWVVVVVTLVFAILALVRPL